MLRFSRGVLRNSYFLWLLFSLVANFTWAQSETATVSGQIVDPSGLNISGAQVKLVDIDRDATTNTLTNPSGLYTVASVRPGRYRMEVTAVGFKVVNATGLIVNIQDHIEQNFKLVVGSVSESITVDGGAPLVDIESATVSTVVDRNFAENLPMNGRSFQTLIMLTPGVVVTPTFAGSPGQFSVNGQRSDANYVTVDGASANVGISGILTLGQSAGGSLPALSALGGTNSLVSVDAIQEFRVETSSFAPEFGRSPGGQVAIVTRSGTNTFHGTIFDYFRNDVLDANDWFSDHNGLTKPEERQNDFGGVVGGPIIKDKAFFFFSYEGLRLRQPISTEILVPDVASRNQAPASFQPYLNAFPVPNGVEMGAGLARFNGSYSNPSTLDAYSLRLDRTISSSLTAFARYDDSPSQVTARGSTSLSYNETSFFDVRTLTLGLTALLSTTVSDELRTNYSNVRVSTSDSLDNFGGAIPIPDGMLFPLGYSATNGQFELLIIGAGTASAGYGGLLAGRGVTNEQRQLNLVDNLSVNKGPHQVKVGVDYRWLAPIADPSPYGLVPIFLGVSGPSGSAVSGVPLLTEVVASQHVSLLSRNLSLYAQDTWKISPRLTLTYGLRWDINPALSGKNSNSVPLTVAGLDNPATMTLASRGAPLYATRYSNMAPRLGIAYQLRQSNNWKSVLRVGGGTFYDVSTGYLASLTSGFPFTATNFPTGPFPLMPQQATPPAITQNLPQTGAFYVADPHLRSPKTYQWNGAIEQSLGGNQLFSVTYIGAVGRNLTRIYNLSDPNPDFQTVSVVTSAATSNYEALQLKFQRRLARGLQALASYSWSHSIDIGSNDSLAVETPFGSPDVDRGDSDFDVRNSMTAALTYDIPPHSASRIGRAILGNWSLDNFLAARSALPVDLVAATSVGAGLVTFTQRPNIVSGVPFYLYGNQYPGGKAFNPAAFTVPPTSIQGDLGRNVLRAFGAWQDDFTIRRQFHLKDNVNIQFRVEMFNVLNHPNFGPPGNNLSIAPFGQSTQTLAASLGSGGAVGGFNPLYQIGGPRSIQLAMKLNF